MINKRYSILDANENIELIATHFLESDLSLRNFASLYCNFSYVTLRTKLLNKLPLKKPTLGSNI